jgi:ABC-type molybdate transport system substrate-binding protein
VQHFLKTLLVLSLIVAGCKKPTAADEAGKKPPATKPPTTSPSSTGGAATTGAGTEPVAKASSAQSGDKPAGETPTEATNSESTSDEEPPAPPAAELVILASASLERVAVALAKQYEAHAPGSKITVKGGAAYELLRGLDETGGDVLLSEGFRGVEVARAAGFVGTDDDTVVSWLPLTLTVAGKKADEIRKLVDLTGEGIKVGVEDPKRSSAGSAASRMFGRAELKVTQRVLPSGAYSALRDGTVDAFITWGAISGIGVPMTLPARLREHLPAVASPINSSKKTEAAKAFVAWLGSEATHATWSDGGTIPTLDAKAPTVATIMPMKLRPPRRDAGCAVVGERIVMVGGNAAGERLPHLTWIDPRTNRATDSIIKLGVGLEGAAVAWSDTRKEVLVAGGRTDAGYTNEVRSFAVSEDRPMAELARLPHPIAHAATAVSGTKLTLFGGIGPGEKKSDVVVQVDLATGQTTTASSRLPTTRAWSTAMTGNSLSWIVGGESEIGGLTDMASFDPIKDLVSRLPQRLTSAVRGMAVARHETGWILLGGNTRKGARDTVDQFDGPDAVKRLPVRLPYPVAYGCAVRLKSKVYLLGGLSRSRVEGRITRLPY